MGWRYILRAQPYVLLPAKAMTSTPSTPKHEKWCLSTPYTLVFWKSISADRRFEKFIRSFIMDIRRAIYATHSVRGLSHTKVPWAEVGQVGPQNFAEFLELEQPLPSSPVTNRCGFGSQSTSRMLITLTSNRTCRSRSGLFTRQFCHKFCLKLYPVKVRKWLVGTQS